MALTSRMKSERWSTINVPPDVRDGMNEVKKHLAALVGIHATDADALRHLLLMRKNKLELFQVSLQAVRNGRDLHD